MNGPTAAPARFPYFEHRTVAEVDIAARAKKSWSRREDRTLRDWLVSGMGRIATAQHLNRSVSSIDNRAQKLGLALRDHRAGRSS